MPVTLVQKDMVRSKSMKGISFPSTRSQIFWYALPAIVLFPTRGSPWFVAITTFSSSGTTPISGMDKISTTSDAVYIAAAIVTALHGIVSRNISPMEH